MQTQMQGQPSVKQKGKLPRWIRPVASTITLIFLGTAAAIWIWSIWHHVPGLPDVMAATFTALGVICAFLAIPILYATRESEVSPSLRGDTTQAISTVFLFNEKLPHPGEFFGRAYERTTLIDRTRKGASTSIVGSRRIGKSWLLTYLKQVAPTKLGLSFHVGYLDASLPKCKTIPGFIAKSLEVLGTTPIISDPTTIGLHTLQEAVESLVQQNQIPVLCIDEFEGLLEAQVFDLNFFTGLRAIAQAGLCLVTASKRPLIDLVSDHVRTSPFFNIFEQIKITPFTIKEAESFVNAKGDKAGFTDKECSYVLEYVQEDEQQRLPIRLQLRGKLLQEDKSAAQTDPNCYLPDTQKYWHNFEKRVEETLQAVMR